MVFSIVKEAVCSQHGHENEIHNEVRDGPVVIYGIYEVLLHFYGAFIVILNVSLWHKGFIHYKNTIQTLFNQYKSCMFVVS